MLFDLADKVLASIVSYLLDYCDFRQLLWLCRRGGLILTKVQSLDVNGVYTLVYTDASGRKPFNYAAFHSLLRVNVTFKHCLYHVYSNLVQFNGVTELKLRFLFVNRKELNILMWWLEIDLSPEICHLSIHVAASSLLDNQHSRYEIAEDVLMLSNLPTLKSFALTMILQNPAFICMCC